MYTATSSANVTHFLQLSLFHFVCYSNSVSAYSCYYLLHKAGSRVQPFTISPSKSNLTIVACLHHSFNFITKQCSFIEYFYAVNISYKLCTLSSSSFHIVPSSTIYAYVEVAPKPLTKNISISPFLFSLEVL
jgi:hypothetical protein